LEYLFESGTVILTTKYNKQHVYDSVLNHWNAKPGERPIETLHPLVTTHPVTGYKVLNLSSGFVTRLDGLKRYESDKLLELLFTHIHTAQDHMVRFRWEKNSVALWDNRYVYLSIPLFLLCVLYVQPVWGLGELI
jgi:sulfonate dioxygenase